MSALNNNEKRKFEDAFHSDIEDFQNWKSVNVAVFLRTQNGITEEMVQKFLKEKILGMHLALLTLEDLEKMGFDALGDRLSVMKVLCQFQVPVMTFPPEKVFNDCVHGHISLHPLIVKIIDTPQFQRLRCLKQLGAAYFVFPAAAHNRFEHCIGVGHLAGELVKTIMDQQPQLKITLKDKLCVEIAGLCHDLGHGPFSHMFEDFVNEARNSESKWTHEDASAKMFDHLLEENNLKPTFRKYGLNEQDLVFITEQITGPLNTREIDFQCWPYKGRSKEKCFLYEVVANKRNGIDVDKWDYFNRDCHNLGFGISFDYKRFLKFARVIEVEGNLQICIRDKEAGNLYDMFYTRNILHRRAYKHRVNRAIECMIIDAFLKANKHLLIEGRNGKKLCISDAVDDMVAYTKMTDYLFYQILYSSSPQLKDSREILSRILSRKLYKFIGQSLPHTEFSQSDEKCLLEEIVKASNGTVTMDDVLVKVVSIDHGMQNKNPIDEVRFYSKNNPELAVQVRKEEVSKMLPNIFAEQSIFVYCRNLEKSEDAEIAFKQWCKIKNITPAKLKLYSELTPLKSEPQQPTKKYKKRLNMGKKMK